MRGGCMTIPAKRQSSWALDWRMKPNPEATTKRPLEGATAALERAAQRARMVARRTGTPLVLGQGGRVEKRLLEGEGERPDSSTQVRPLAAQQGL